MSSVLEVPVAALVLGVDAAVVVGVVEFDVPGGVFEPDEDVFDVDEEEAGAEVEEA